MLFGVLNGFITIDPYLSSASTTALLMLHIFGMIKAHPSDGQTDTPSQGKRCFWKNIIKPGKGKLSILLPGGVNGEFQSRQDMWNVHSTYKGRAFITSREQKLGASWRRRLLESIWFTNRCMYDETQTVRLQRPIRSVIITVRNVIRFLYTDCG